MEKTFWSIALPEGFPNNIALFGLVTLVSTFYTIGLSIATISKNTSFIIIFLLLAIPTITIVIVCSNVLRPHHGFVLKKGDYKKCKYSWTGFEDLPKDKLVPFILWCDENFSDVCIKESKETGSHFRCRIAKFRSKEDRLLTALTWS